MVFWSVSASAVAASFTASIVEMVEAFTIILAVGTIRGWKPALTGTLAALGILCLVVIGFYHSLSLVPLEDLQLVIGILLLLFGMGWLRKAILRQSGLLPLHDENAAFASGKADLVTESAQNIHSLNVIAGLMAFKAVLLEGLEVVFIVIAVGAGNGLLVPASIGALAACIVVLIIGLMVRTPLSRVPENTLKFAVGIMLTSFGVFWTGEGLGVDWPGHDFILFGFVLNLVCSSLLAVAVLKKSSEG